MSSTAGRRTAQAARFAVDYWSVGSPCFADVLTDAMRAAAGPVKPTPGASTHPFRVAPRDPFLFVALPALSRAGGVFALDALTESLRDARRPARALTAGQWQSLTALNALGAQLTPDFTAQELRRTYRWLVFRVHPDRQHRGGDAERERRSRQFREATEHYRRLLELVVPPSQAR